jgi:hypothetical protein
VPLWYALLAVMVSMLIVSAAGIWYTNHVQRGAELRAAQDRREADRRWCELLTILAGGPAATTERGRAIADAMARLRDGLGC